MKHPYVKAAKYWSMILGALCASIIVSGCGDRAEKKDILAAETSNLKPLSVLYGQYQSRNQNQPPATEDAFKKFIETNGKSTLDQFKIDINQLFISQRDGQPYVVLYRGKVPPSGVIAYEQNGVGGERIVAYPFGALEMANEARFQELVPAGP